jgi:Raf kinase inhibitor-like YbhB/YbcL family protein
VQYGEVELVSDAFANNSPIPQKYTCKGENISPPLRVLAIPPDTQSMALVVEDLDASPRPRVHWFVFNIPSVTADIFEGKPPNGGMEGFANGGKPGYEGPCPGYFKGVHRYRFRVIALKTSLDAPETITLDDIEQIFHENTIAQADLIGTVEEPGRK